jgi:hypothetical protein
MLSLYICAMCVFLGVLIREIYPHIVLRFQLRKSFKKFGVQKVDYSKLCGGDHRWLYTKTTGKESIEKQDVCIICGLLSDRSGMVTSEALDKLEEDNRVAEIYSGIKNSFQHREMLSVMSFFDKEIKGGLVPEKLFKVYDAGVSSSQRYQRYLLEHQDKIDKDTKRGNA